jgi:hypothetical protein
MDAYGGLDEGIPEGELFNPDASQDAQFENTFNANAAQQRKTLEDEINEEINKMKQAGPGNASADPTSAIPQSPFDEQGNIKTPIYDANKARMGSGKDDGGKSDAEYTKRLMEQDRKQKVAIPTSKPAATDNKPSTPSPKPSSPSPKYDNPFSSEQNPNARSQSKGKPGDYKFLENEPGLNEPGATEDNVIFDIIETALGAAGLASGLKALWKTGGKEMLVKLFRRNPDKAIDTAKRLVSAGGQPASLKAATQEVKDIANPWARDTSEFVKKWSQENATKAAKPKPTGTNIMTKKGQSKIHKMYNKE